MFDAARRPVPLAHRHPVRVLAGVPLGVLSVPRPCLMRPGFGHYADLLVTATSPQTPRLELPQRTPAEWQPIFPSHRNGSRGC